MTSIMMKKYGKKNYLINSMSQKMRPKAENNE